MVVAHRGDSSRYAENTLPAFAAAKADGAVMIEFDVRATRDGRLVCMHDDSLDRTTDAARQLGPGALVANLTLAEIERLDAGSWHPVTPQRTPVPTLAAALTTMLPEVIPMVEHKAGDAAAFVAELRQARALSACILQSFDWDFVLAAKQAAPEVAVALLGPRPGAAILDDSVITRAVSAGAGMLHWDHRALDRASVQRCHAAGLLVCTYTTDDVPGWLGGRVLGIDAACTNRPRTMAGITG